MNLHDEMFDKPKEPVITWQGVFPNISYDEYDAWDAIRPTMVKQMSNKPAQKVKYEMDNPREPSAIQIFGQAVHCAVLEPDKFESEFCFKPEDTDRRTKAGKAAYAEWKAATEDKIEVPKPKGLESPEKVISGMVTSLKTNRWASRLLDGAQAEVSIRWTTGGTKLKARLDGIKGGVLLDLKTTNNASPEAFMRTSYKFAYHIQAAMGWDGWEANGNKPERYVFIVVETSPPYMVNVLEVELAMLEYGRKEYLFWIGVIKRCQESGEWPGYCDYDIQSLMLPPWAGSEL